MDFKFTPLGIASAQPTVNRYQSAHVLKVHGRLFLIDCGEGCQMQLRRSGFSLLKINAIFISHLHGDHLFGLPGLLSSMSMLGRGADLDIYAPKEFKPLLEGFLSYFGGEFLFKVNHIEVRGDEVTLIREERRSEVYSFPLNHRVPCWGYLFKEKEPQLNIYKELVEKHQLSLYQIARLKEGKDVINEDGELYRAEHFTYKPYKPRSFAYCSDTAPFKELAHYLNQCDMIYHETTFTKEHSQVAIKTGHSTAADAATVALEAGVKKLLIGHFSSRYRELTPFLDEAREIFPESYIATQGEQFEIEIKRDNKKE